MTDETDTSIRQARPSPAAISPPRQLYWSVRREIWEHGSIWIAPVVVAAIALLGIFLGSQRLPGAIRHLSGGAEQAKKAAFLISAPYGFVCFAVLATGLIVAVFYCLGTLYNERRDRSVLFWKSLPVSDLITVLAKAAVPLVVLPVILFAVIITTTALMLVLGTAVVTAAGLDAHLLWANASVLPIWSKLAAALPFMAVWYTPVFAWLMLVSVWSKRAPFLWALGAPLALALVERLALGSAQVWDLIVLRMGGVFAQSMHDGDNDPVRWTNPDLWTGLIVAVALLALAVRLRRSRDAI